VTTFGAGSASRSDYLESGPTVYKTLFGLTCRSVWRVRLLLLVARFWTSAIKHGLSCPFSVSLTWSHVADGPSPPPCQGHCYCISLSHLSPGTIVSTRRTRPPREPLLSAIRTAASFTRRRDVGFSARESAPHLRFAGPRSGQIGLLITDGPAQDTDGSPGDRSFFRWFNRFPPPQKGRALVRWQPCRCSADSS